MGELGEWSKKNSKFLVIRDGDTVQAKFNGARIVPSTFDPEKETVSYKLGEQTWNCSARSLAAQMDKVPMGTEIAITRTGEGPKTRYAVKVL